MATSELKEIFNMGKFCYGIVWAMLVLSIVGIAGSVGVPDLFVNMVLYIGISLISLSVLVAEYRNKEDK